jgi:hypothetical protein
VLRQSRFDRGNGMDVLSSPRVRIACRVVIMLAMSFVPAAGQQDSVTVIAGSRYRLDPALHPQLGSGYRNLWTVPIRVPLLRPDTFAGGLTLLQRGTGMQTASLRFRGADGAEYVFRSVDKNQEGGLPEDLHGTITSRLIQDQVSAKHPAAAIIVDPLLSAAGVPHPVPRLAVMLDHPSLGEHREEFGGMLGTIEERPEERDEAEGFGGFVRIVGTESLLERIAVSADDRVDPSAYLRARLLDLLVGDWDRHGDQWRWGARTGDGATLWIAIPRDRDNAFFSADGLLARLGGAFRSNVQKFEDRYTNVGGLVHNAQRLDRLILPALPLPVWMAIAGELRVAISDEVITTAVRKMPPEYFAIGGADLERKLRSRRDLLEEVAYDFYLLLATEVDVHATDGDDRALMTRRGDGSARVQLFASGDRSTPYFDRTFMSGETREVRVHLAGGADLALVEGEGSGITIRVIAGEHGDILEDRSTPRAARATVFHLDGGLGRAVPARGTRIERRAFVPPVSESPAENNAPPPRDWGRSFAPFAPEVRWDSRIGPVVGGGPAWTRYGFRHLPYAVRARTTLLVAPLHQRVGAVGEIHRIHTGGFQETRLEARASQISNTRFLGFGNETSRGAPGAPDLIWATEYGTSAELTHRLGARSHLVAGPRVSYLDPEPSEWVPRAPGGDPYGLAGFRVTGVFDGRGTGGVSNPGVRVAAFSEAYPLTWGSVSDAVLRGGAWGSAILPLPGPLEPRLGVRAAGELVSSGAPLQQGAFLGGGGSLRGYPDQHFVGDAAASGSAELRTRLTRVDLLVARTEVGSLLFVDAGRVFVRGERSTRVHIGKGVGLWFATLNRALVGHAAIASGEGVVLHGGFGMPF